MDIEGSGRSPLLKKSSDFYLYTSAVGGAVPAPTTAARVAFGPRLEGNRVKQVCHR